MSFVYLAMHTGSDDEKSDLVIFSNGEDARKYCMFRVSEFVKILGTEPVEHNWVVYELPMFTSFKEALENEKAPK